MGVMLDTNQNDWCSSLVKRTIFQYLTWDEKLLWMNDTGLKFADIQLDQQVQEWSEYRCDLAEIQKDSQQPNWLDRSSLSVIYPYKTPCLELDQQTQIRRIYFHTLSDIYQSERVKSISQTELPLQQYLLPNRQIDNGIQVSFAIPIYLPFLSQIQIVADSLDQLEAIIYNLKQLELDIGDQRIDRTVENLIQLEWELYKQTHPQPQKDTGRYVYPIFKNFCQPHRPHPIGLQAAHQTVLVVEFLWESDLAQNIPNWTSLNLEANRIFQVDYQPLDFRRTTPSINNIYVERLIVQWQFTGVEWCSTRNHHCQIRLHFNHPCSCLLILVNSPEVEDPVSGQVTQTQDKLIDAIDNITLQMCGVQVYTDLKVPGWVLSQAVQEKLGLPRLSKSNQTYYLLSFNELTPFQGLEENLQSLNPLVNFSLLDSVTLTLHWKESIVQTYDELHVRIFAQNTNVLSLNSHMCGYLYSF